MQPLTREDQQMHANSSSNVSQSVPAMNHKVSLMELVPEWSKYTMTIYLCIVFAIGLPGNALVVYVQAKYKSKSVTDWMMLYLAICDVISLCVCVPTFVLHSIDMWKTIAPDFFCKLHALVLHSVFNASNAFIALTALARYSKTLCGKAIFRTQTAGYIGCAVFVLSICLALVSVFVYKNSSTGFCVLLPMIKHLGTLLFGITCALTVISCTITCSCYIKIGMYLRSLMRVTPADTTSAFGIGRSRASTATMAVAFVALVFVLSSVVPSIFAILLVNRATTEYNHTRMVLVFFLTRLYFINNFSNPFFYWYLNSAFRKRAIDTLEKLVCTR